MTEPLMLSDEETQFLLRAEELGWKLVPMKATPEIIEALEGDYRYPSQRWEAAVRAVPMLNVR